MAIATLSIDLIAQLANLQAGMDKAGRLAEKNAALIAKKYQATSAVFQGLGITIGSALSVAGITAFVRSTVDGLDKLNDLADATGSTVERLSALEDAAARTGTGIDTVGDAIIKLNKTIADAKPGTDAAAALDAIGLSAKQLRDLDPADALVRVAQALAGFADDGNKARLSQELFGKSLKDVAPLLKDLVEKGQLNATVTTEQAAAAEKFKKQTFELNKNLTDLARDINGALVPALNKLFERSKKEGIFSALFTPDDTSKLIAQADSLSNSITNVGNALKRATDLSQRADLPGSARSSWAEQATRLRAQLEGLQRESLRITDLLKGTAGTAGQRSARDRLRQLEADSAERPSAPGVIGKVEVSEFDKFIKRLREAQLSTVELTEVEKTRIAINKGELGAITKHQVDYAVAVAETVDLLKRLGDTSKLALQSQAGQLEDLDRQSALVRQQFADGVISATTFARAIDVLSQKIKVLQDNTNIGTDKFRVDVFRLAAQSRDAQVDDLAAQIQNVREQMRQASGNTTVFQRALAVLAEQMRAVEDNTQGLGEKLGQLNEDVRFAAGEIENAFGASIVAGMEGNAKKIDRIWGDMIRRMVAQAASAKLVSTLFGEGFTSRGEVGGWVGRLFGAFGGSTGGGAGSGSTNVVSEVVKNAGGASKASAAGSSKPSQASAQGGGNFFVTVQGDVGPKAMRAMQTVVAQMEARRTRQAAF